MNPNCPNCGRPMTLVTELKRPEDQRLTKQLLRRGLRRIRHATCTSNDQWATAGQRKGVDRGHDATRDFAADAHRRRPRWCLVSVVMAVSASVARKKIRAAEQQYLPQFLSQ